MLKKIHWQLVKLRTELDRARTIVDLMRKRDRLKKEQLLLELLIFEQKTRIHAIELRHPELAIKKDKREPQMHMQPQQFSMRPTERIVIRLPTDMDSAAATGGRANYADRRPQQTAMPPPLEPEPIQDWRNGPPDHVFRGTDLQHNTYNRLLDLPLAPNMPEASYVDLTHAIQWGMSLAAGAVKNIPIFFFGFFFFFCNCRTEKARARTEAVPTSLHRWQVPHILSSSHGSQRTMYVFFFFQLLLF